MLNRRDFSVLSISSLLASKPSMAQSVLNGTIRAVCEDCRAAAGIDLDDDRASDAEGHKVQAPLLALWGASGTVGQLWDVLGAWCNKSAKPVTGAALPRGHLLSEEQPELVIKHFQSFFI